MNQQTNVKTKQEASWQYEFDKKQERKQSKSLRNRRKAKRYQWTEGV